jgi:tetratricopeptide (TPR) repeat protein
LLNRIAERRAAKLYHAGRSDAGPMDEDALPWAAAVLASVTDPVPVGAVERPMARAGQVAWRAAVLVALVALTYLPTLMAPALLTGEGEAFARQPVPVLTWQGWRDLPGSLVQAPPFGAPPLLRILLHLDTTVGNGTLSHHAAGTVLHAAVTVLLWLVLRRLNRPGAWLAAAMFAVNPGAAAAVEWLGLRGRAWGALLALAGCWLLLRAAAVPPPIDIEPAEYDPEEEPGGPMRWLSLAVRPTAGLLGVVALLAAALCQPTVAAVGLVAVLLVAWRRGLRAWDSLWIVPVLILTGMATVAALHMPPPADRDPTVLALPQALQPLWWTGAAVERVAWPLAWADLALAGSRPTALATAGVGIGFFVALVGLVLLKRRIGAGPAVAAGCFALLLPTMMVPSALPAVPGLTAAQQVGAAATYLVAIPVLVVLADAVVAAARRVRGDLPQRGAELAAAAGAVLALGWITTVRAAAFDDTEAILKTSRVANGRSWDYRSRLAEWYLSQGRPDPALDLMSGLTTANCPDAATAVAQGDLLAADRDLTGALAWYRLGRKLEPAAVAPVAQESSIYLRQGRVGDAIDTYERAIADHPNSAALLNDFGQLLTTQGDLPLAEAQFRRSVAVEPEAAATHVMLAENLAGQHRIDEAAVEFQEAIRLDPENFDAFHNVGQILVGLGDDDRAVQWLVRAVSLRPDLPQPRNDLAVALIRSGRAKYQAADLELTKGHGDLAATLAEAGAAKYKRAEFELTAALKLQPDYSSASMNLVTLRRFMERQRQRASVEGK